MWMVRAGPDAFLIDDFKRKKYVAIGWNELGDISNVKKKEDVKALVEKHKEKYEYIKISQVNTAAGQISKFLFNFEKGDYVLSYDPTNRVYLVSEIVSAYEFNTSLSEYHHIRRVKILGEVPRDKLSPSTRNTLGAISTLFEINESAASEIIYVLRGKAPSKEIVAEEDEESLKEDMVSRAKELIKDKILELDWENMEKLVAGILKSMGYKTLITERGPDRGKDIEASPDGLLLEEPRILVEVKHRKGQMGTKEIRNLLSVLRGRKGLFVSTGGFSKEAKYVSEGGPEQLTLIDTDRLVKMIIENYDNFDVDTKLLIPLSKIYWPL
ncbi:MAG: restriction endonuclease [Candidatus Aenigmarchaeota archaeon]|nr:restriction endonuclease [Candidatus Aenigmarchaeota archaeon]